MTYTIYNKNGTARTSIKKLTYNGVFMDKKTISASIESPVPIAFEIFDYIDYRGERFVLDYQPTDKKQARRESSGDAFVYDLIFVSSIYELERCQFRDLVPNDNNIHYATPLNITFTGNVTKLAERIQACLDADYGAGVWKINVLETGDLEEKNIAISNANCWEALALVNSQYKLSYYINKRVVNIGGTIPVVSTVFKYGKGKGLYDIKRNAQNDTGIVTRLRAFGSTRNLDASYNKRPEWPESIVPSTQYLPNLMLPTYRTELKDYIDSANTSIYGIRPATIVYDDIYPSISGVSLPGVGRIDQLVSADKVTSDSQATFKVQIKDIGFDINDNLTNETAVISMKSGALTGYGFEIVSGGIVKNAQGYQLTLNRNTTDNYTVPNVDLNLGAGDEFVLLNILMPKSYITNAEDRLKQRALEYLAQYDHTNFSYEINLEDQFLAENPTLYQSLFEGQRLKIQDEDLGIDNEGVIIQSLTITEGDNAIPSVKIVLDNNPAASTLNRIQGQVSELESTVVNSFANMAGATMQYYKKLDKAVFDKAFKLIEENNVLKEIQAQAMFSSTGDIWCYSTGEHDIVLPQAGYGALGAVSVLPDSGILIDSNGAIRVDPDWKGGGGGVDFTTGSGLQLIGNVLSVKYGTTVDTVMAGNDSRVLNGQKAFDQLSKATWWGQKIPETGIVTGALTGVTNINAKLALTDTGVDVTGNFTATGDIVAYATAEGDITDWLSQVIDDVTIKIDESGKLYVAGGGGGSISDITTTGTGNAITAVTLSDDKKGLTFTKGSTFALKTEIPTSLKNPYSLSWSGYNSGSYDGSASKSFTIPSSLSNPYSLSWSGYNSGSYSGSSSASFTIPSSTSQLSNGAGYITGITSSMILNALNGSGNSSKYLAGNGTFYTIAYSEISGTPSLNFLPLSGGTLTGDLWIKSGDASKLTVANRAGEWGIFGASVISDVSCAIQTSKKFLIIARNNYNNRVEFSNGDVAATGDVVAYSTGSASSPFKYWLPYVDTSGNISWSNSTSESTPATRNIRGPSGATGQGVSYQWSGTSLRLGTISSSGSTSWGSYVNLQGATGPTGARGATGPQGPQGPQGPSWSGGTVSSLAISGSGTRGLNIYGSGGSGEWASSFVQMAVNGSGSAMWQIRASGNGDMSFAKSNLNSYSRLFYLSGSNAGNAWLKGSLSQSSDMRLKNRLQDVSGVLEKLEFLDVFHYTLKDDMDSIPYIGVSAQAVKSVFPELVTMDDTTGMYSVNYVTLATVAAIGGIKELQAYVKTLEGRIEKLEEQLNNVA